MRRARVRGAFLVLCGWALILAIMALRDGGAPSPTDEERREAARLAQRVLLLEAELAASQRLEGLAERFRATPFIGFSMLAARISAPFDLSPRRRSALVDAGSAQGVLPGDGVIASEGIVGRIAAGEEQRSRVQLADDPEFRVEFQVVRDGRVLRGIARGGPNAGEMTTLFREDGEPLVQGDLAVTAGDEVFPPGIVLGRLTGEFARPAEARIALGLALAEPWEVMVLRRETGAPRK